MADVFISYASQDRERVKPLAEALASHGFNVWWDRELAAGQDYAQIIERELKGAKAVIVVWSNASAASTYVRDEAGRARDEGRLVPVMLDPIAIPLGFGAFQAEDFTRWNGNARAPQVGLLEEVLRAKLEGREIDGKKIADKRRKVASRVRLVSLLTVVALIVAIAVGGKYFLQPQQHHATQQDLQAQLLQLLAEGKLTPEQAAQLAQSMGLEQGALGAASSQVASNDGTPAAAPGVAPSDSATLQPASEQQFSADARTAYNSAITALLTHPDASVRQAALSLSNEQQRPAAIQTLTAYAQAHPDDAQSANMLLAAAAVGEANNTPNIEPTLEAAATAAPNNPASWRMLSRWYHRSARPQEAQAAADVSQAVEAQAQGNSAAAETQLQQALPNLGSAELRAPVASQLGHIAERRGDFSAASARFAQAYSLREQTAQAAPSAAATQSVQADAQSLVLALNRSGRTQEACQRLQEAQQNHDVAAPDQATLDQCQRMRVQLRPNVQLSPAIRRNAVVAPSTPASPSP
ncbi:MAG: toll/interleukin-1 receptor domain-containing protein [Terricaulis sp.]